MLLFWWQEEIKLGGYVCYIINQNAAWTYSTSRNVRLGAGLAVKIQVIQPFCLWKSQGIKIITCLLSKLFISWLFPYHYSLHSSVHQYFEDIDKYFLKTKSSGCLCRLIEWALSCTSESWLLSNNLISQMEKQHLFSCSSTYGSHCCCVELKQVVPRSTALGSPAAPWDRPPPLGCGEHRFPRHLEPCTSTAYAKHLSQPQTVGENTQTRVWGSCAGLFGVGISAYLLQGMIAQGLQKMSSCHQGSMRGPEIFCRQRGVCMWRKETEQLC